MARPRASNDSKQRAGTFREETKAKVEQYFDIKPPKPPTYFNASARRVWKATVTELIRLGLLHHVDFTLLAAYCMEMGIYADCMKNVKQFGAVVEFSNGEQRMMITSPHYKTANIALKEALKLCKEFGLSPASRNRINLVVQGEHQPDFDQFNDI